MILSVIASFLLGLSKAGLKGPGVAIVGLVAMDFGSRASTGILLPLLVAADVMAVAYYRSHVDWFYLKKLLPMMIVGVLAAAVFGQQIDEANFKYWMASIVLIGLVLMIVRDVRWRHYIPKHNLFSSSMGFAAGFTTMLGNLAGPFANIYFLSQNLTKNTFIGTAAWLFLFINLFKLPLHAFYWKTIDRETLTTDLDLLLYVIVGFLVGIVTVKKINEWWYRTIIYLSTAVGVVFIFLSK